MMEIVSRIQLLLSMQVQAQRQGMHAMSEAEWLDYRTRDKLIAQLFDALETESPN